MTRRRFIPKLIQSFTRFCYSALAYHTIMVFIVLCLTIGVLLVRTPSSDLNEPIQPRAKNFIDTLAKTNPLRFLKRRRSLRTLPKSTSSSGTTTTSYRLKDLARHRYVDVQGLGVNIKHLDSDHQKVSSAEIEYPNMEMHFLSDIVDVKGDPSMIFFNRVPNCYEHTFQRLLAQISLINSFNYLSSTIYTPFAYNPSVLLNIARSLLNRTVGSILYERHVYFFNFYDLKIATHPVWINLVRDPMYRVAFEYQRTRDICRDTGRCFVQKDLLNLTLDQCVLIRSPRECISPANGVSRMLPFFCGSKELARCSEESDWAVNEAKQNIQYYYTVIGIAEEFYKFLYLLERLLPSYFKLSRLVYVNQWEPEWLRDHLDVYVAEPTKKTHEILRPLLHFEYQLYDFIKERFHNQYQILFEADQ